MQPYQPNTPPHTTDAPAGQPPYAPPPQAGPQPYAAQPHHAAPPHHAAQPHHAAPPPYAAAPQSGPPPYAAAPAPYLAQTDAAREARERKGKRDIGFGVVWVIAGLLITGITMASDSSVYLVAWGPVVYGIYLIVRGAIAVSRSRR
jgi:hypothetical protein